MRAAFMTGVNTVEIRKTREPDVDPQGAILRVEACGICGTDARTFFNGDPKAPAPWILGHEPVGVIEELGPGAHLPPGVKKGDRVFLGSILTCGQCRWCTEGFQNLCDQHLLYGYDPYPGAYADYAPVPAIAMKNVIALPPDLPSDLATVADPFACALNAVEVSPAGRPADGGEASSGRVLRGTAQARPGEPAGHQSAALQGTFRTRCVRSHASPVPNHNGLSATAPRPVGRGGHPSFPP